MSNESCLACFITILKFHDKSSKWCTQLPLCIFSVPTPFSFPRSDIHSWTFPGFSCRIVLLDIYPSQFTACWTLPPRQRVVVMPCLDYGNATLAGLPASQLRRLQSVLNAATRLSIYIDLLSMSTSHRCCKTFTGCGLRNASISIWLCSFTDACMVLSCGKTEVPSSRLPNSAIGVQFSCAASYLLL